MSPDELQKLMILLNSEPLVSEEEARRELGIPPPKKDEKSKPRPIPIAVVEPMLA